MESPLQYAGVDLIVTPTGSFNPCFSGISSSISRRGVVIAAIVCFNPCFSGISSSINPFFLGYVCPSWVSILVLVESPLQWFCGWRPIQASPRFNPCFSGISSSIIRQDLFGIIDLCFNPCFSGISSSMVIRPCGELMDLSFNPCFSGISSSMLIWYGWIDETEYVSILVLVESPLQYPETNPHKRWKNDVSILVLVESPLQ